MQHRYFLTLLGMVVFSTGMNVHGGGFDQPSIFFIPRRDSDGRLKMASGDSQNNIGEVLTGGNQSAAGGSTAKDAKANPGGSTRNVQPRPEVKDREKVQDRVPVKRP